MPDHCEQNAGDSNLPVMMTTAEAATILCYTSTSAFRRAWRRAGLAMFPQLGEHRLLVKRADVQKFIATPVVDRVML